MKRRLALEFPAPLVSSWACAGAVAAADGTGGATLRASAGAAAALLAASAAAGGLLRRPQQAPAQQLLLLLNCCCAGLSKSTSRDCCCCCCCRGGGLRCTKKKRDRLIRCMSRDSWSRDRRHVWPITVVGRACRRAMAILHAGLHVLRHSRTCVLGQPDAAA